MMLDGLKECFYKNVFCDKVLPRPGSVLKIDLVLNPIGSLCHTGIYVGNNRIVELANVDGTGVIKKVSPRCFLNYSSLRTGIFIYVACGRKNGKYYPLADPKIAERALNAVGHKTEYDFLRDNCHLFVEYCITGKRHSLIGTLENIEERLTRKFRLPKSSLSMEDIPEILVNPASSCLRQIPVYWMSTGVGSNGAFPAD